MVSSMVSNSVEFLGAFAAFLQTPVPFVFVGLGLTVIVFSWFRSLMR